MGRGRGKGKKQTAIASTEDLGNGENRKILPTYRKRGRPLKPLKNDVEEEDGEDVEKIEENGEDTNGNGKDTKNLATTNNGRKKRSPQVKENIYSVKEDSNDVDNKTGTDNPMNNSVGFRQNGSRRKNKPRRAAEAGVECKFIHMETSKNL